MDFKGRRRRVEAKSSSLAGTTIEPEAENTTRRAPPSEREPANIEAQGMGVINGRLLLALVGQLARLESRPPSNDRRAGSVDKRGPRQTGS